MTFISFIYLLFWLKFSVKFWGEIVKSSSSLFPDFKWKIMLAVRLSQLPFISFKTFSSNEVKVTQSCPTLFDPMVYTVHEIFQIRILELVAFPFSRESSQPRDQTQVSSIEGRFFISWATREAHDYWSG